MNMQLREADWTAKDAIEAPVPAQSVRRRRRIAWILAAATLLLIAGGAFYVWYMTMCGNCGPVITCAKRCTTPIIQEQIERLKAQDQISPDPAPQTR